MIGAQAPEGVIRVPNYLPVGSVVKLNGIEKRFVIAGVLQMEEDGDGTMHDYLGHPYPEGYLGPGLNFLFDEADIEDIVFRGYEDEEREGFLQFVDLMLAAQAEGIDLASLALGVDEVGIGESIEDNDKALEETPLQGESFADASDRLTSGIGIELI